MVLHAPDDSLLRFSQLKHSSNQASGVIRVMGLVLPSSVAYEA